MINLIHYLVFNAFIVVWVFLIGAFCTIDHKIDIENTMDAYISKRKKDGDSENETEN